MSEKIKNLLKSLYRITPFYGIYYFHKKKDEFEILLKDLYKSNKEEEARKIKRIYNRMWLPDLFYIWGPAVVGILVSLFLPETIGEQVARGGILFSCFIYGPVEGRIGRKLDKLMSEYKQ